MKKYEKSSVAPPAPHMILQKRRDTRTPPPTEKSWLHSCLGHTKLLACVVQGIYGHDSLVEMNQATFVTIVQMNQVI